MQEAAHRAASHIKAGDQIAASGDYNSAKLWWAAAGVAYETALITAEHCELCRRSPWLF